MTGGSPGPGLRRNGPLQLKRETANADDCATSVGKIDEALKTATLDDAGKTKVTELVTKAKAEGDKGDAAACDATTKEAMTLLGM
jgi:hypothetical protein